MDESNEKPVLNEQILKAHNGDSRLKDKSWRLNNLYVIRNVL